MDQFFLMKCGYLKIKNEKYKKDTDTNFKFQKFINSRSSPPFLVQIGGVPRNFILIYLFPLMFLQSRHAYGEDFKSSVLPCTSF